MSNEISHQGVSRRHFLSSLGFGTAGMVILGSYGFTIRHDRATGTIRAIAVDFEKCAGCRTCEAVCSAFNHMESVNGRMVNGIGNPSLSNIRVIHYNPDIDIPSTCALCHDAPCVAACPVEPHSETGYRALYRNPELLTITNDTERCIGCGSCADACRELRAGIIRSNPETGNPEHMCTLCGGDPQCVQYCPFDALSYVVMDNNRNLEGLSPRDIAARMIKKLYNIKVTETQL